MNRLNCGKFPGTGLMIRRRRSLSRPANSQSAIRQVANLRYKQISRFAAVNPFGFRPSDFFRISDFGFRI